MKTTTIVISAIIAVFVLSFIALYNGQISKDEKVNESWGNVESTYQRRADLIPNLVSTVKQYAAHEKETLESVVKARQQVSQVNVEMKDAKNISPEMMKKFSESQGQLSSALSRLLVTVERYPDLKANQNFMDLQRQLEGTENRINVARRDYNSSVKSLNTSVRSLFGKIISGFTGVETRESFKADEGSQKAPKVSFD